MSNEEREDRVEGWAERVTHTDPTNINPFQAKPQREREREHGVASETLARMGEQLEAEYRAERKQAAERLHNAFADVIEAQQPSVETLLYVIEMMKHEMLTQEHNIVYEPASHAKVSNKKPSAVGIA